MWTPHKKNQSQSCMISETDQTELWHRKLSHLNIKSTRKIAYEKDIISLLDLKIEERKICGDC